jgi:hypothetical protein
MSPTVTDKKVLLLPPATDLRRVAAAVAKTVDRHAQPDVVAPPCDAAMLDACIAACVLEPQYRKRG